MKLRPGFRLPLSAFQHFSFSAFTSPCFAISSSTGPAHWWTTSARSSRPPMPCSAKYDIAALDREGFRRASACLTGISTPSFFRISRWKNWKPISARPSTPRSLPSPCCPTPAKNSNGAPPSASALRPHLHGHARLRASDGRLRPPPPFRSHLLRRARQARGHPSILETHGLNPAETAFVGDMTHDVETARHGGISSIAVLTGYNHAEILAAVRPDITVPDLGVLRTLLDRRRSVSRPIATVGALSTMAHGKVLMVRTHKWGNRWGIPGGKIERGESSTARVAPRNPRRNRPRPRRHRVRPRPGLHRLARVHAPRAFPPAQLRRPRHHHRRHPQRRGRGIPLAAPRPTRSPSISTIPPASS